MQVLLKLPILQKQQINVFIIYLYFMNLLAIEVVYIKVIFFYQRGDKNEKQEELN